MSSRPLETALTLVLEHCDDELSSAHRELYPERIHENLPFSLTLLYPWLPAGEVDDERLDELRAFFTSRPILDFELVRVADMPGAVAYTMPEPDDELRATMRALWALYPECPPYRQPGSNPPPHATLARYAAEGNVTFADARARVEPLLPVRCLVEEATLLEEHEPDRFRFRASFPFAR